MNILYVTPDFPDKGQPTTGFPNYLYRVSMALIEMGHKPVILSAGKRSDKRFEKGIEIIKVPYYGIEFDNEIINYTVNSIWLSYVLNRKIKELESTVKFDIIQFTSLSGVSILYNGRTPSVMRLSSYAKTAYATYQTISPNIVKNISFIERIASRRCNAVFSPSINNAIVFGKDIRRKVYTIETPFIEDVTEYDECYVNNDLKYKKYALFFGTLYAEKGIKVIGECLNKFLSDNKEFYFVFVGSPRSIDGENAVHFLKRCASNNVDRTIFFPELTHNCLYPIIQNSEFVVLPSLMENLSNACIEAMYFGKVVIGTDGASFEQLINHKVSGLLCKIGDSDDLLAKMQIAVNMDKSEKERIGKNAKKRIEKLKPEVAVKRLVAFYQKVIENSNKKNKVFCRG
jgi:glycosyltransferase involved in cell wall biosynthesis